MFGLRAYEMDPWKSGENCARNQAAKNDDDPKDYLGVQVLQSAAKLPEQHQSVLAKWQMKHLLSMPGITISAPTKSTTAEAAVSCG